MLGKDLDEYEEKYDWDLVQQFPEDVKIVKGRDLLCIEGCQNNTLSCLQIFAYDAPKKFKGGWFIVMGKGHDKNIVEQLKKEGYKKGLVVGYCAINEVGDKLKKAFKRRVHFSGDCNNLVETLKALHILSGVRGSDLSSIPLAEYAKLVREARKNGTTALFLWR